MDLVDLVSFISFVSEITRSHTSYFPTKPSLVMSTKLRKFWRQHSLFETDNGLKARSWGYRVGFLSGNVFGLELNTRKKQLQNERTAVRMPIRSSTSTFWVSLPTMRMRMTSNHEIMLREPRTKNWRGEHPDSVTCLKEALQMLPYQDCSSGRIKFQFDVLPGDRKVIHRLLLNPFLPHAVYHDIIKVFEK